MIYLYCYDKDQNVQKPSLKSRLAYRFKTLKKKIAKLKI
jgi:hypothetical protein